MFNFFVLQTRLNDGMAWTYMFLPLLIALVIKIMESANQEDNEARNKDVIYFAIISTITLSFGSINPANVIIVFLVLGMIILYYCLMQRKKICFHLLNISKLIIISVLFNLWWTIPILNYYLWSSTTLTPVVSATEWSWTHQRASFLNLFWLNGGWGWRPEYIPYIDSYSNPILIILTFIPFLLAATALLFKTQKSRFNSYLMLTILLFIFLAKGLHEPLSQVNLLFYTYIPGMAMFREPISKFTMALMPLLALLVGYAISHVVMKVTSEHKAHTLLKTSITTFFILSLIVSVYPLVTNPIETRTSQLPFSSYIIIPNYWQETSDWLNNQSGEYKILIMPPDDFYAVPYTWGYYGTDQFLERLIQKPIISNYYTYSYKPNPNITLTLQQLSDTVKYNRTAEFKTFLDLLNAKYILQRNDVYYNFTGRNIIAPNEMEIFLTQQPYLSLAKRFGQLDVYEYTDAKPYTYILTPASLEHIMIKIDNITTLENFWHFADPQDIQEWQNATNVEQWQINYAIIQENSTLKAELWNSTWGWKTINCPLLPVRYGNTYQIQINVKGQNAHEVHIRIAEYDEHENIITATYAAYVHDETFDWTNIALNYELTNKTAEYLQIQIWHGDRTDKPFPNIIWIDNVQIKGYTTILNTTGLDLIFPNTTQNQPATILNYTKINPTKITATVNATHPFILAISEALDNQWTAYVNGKQIKPTPLYLCITGFQINQTGVLDIVIEYEPQRWFYIGCAISITTFLTCTAYLAYSYTKTKHLLQKLKQKLRKQKT
jgi:hypothetical protein